MNRIRRNRLLPRQVSDVGAFVFVVFMIPATYVYEVAIVVPALYQHSTQSYLFHMAVATFLLLNLVGNFLGLWLTDTSTRFIVLPSVIKNSKWKFCAACESVAPPRSWHCTVCNVCILKREHHCMFVGYCVGHRNHRYFFLFLFYMWLSVVYCTYFNTAFLSGQLSGSASIWGPQLVKFIFPIVMMITGLDASWLQLYIFFWSVHFAAFLLTTVLLLYHVNLVIHGRTTFESNRSVDTYDLGRGQNLVEVFGSRWKLCLVWPFASSKLPHNGVDWDTKETWRLEGPKTR